jgi:hypothetical protein
VSDATVQTLTRLERRRLVAIGLLRAVTIVIVVVGGYYLLPLDNLTGVSLAVALAVGLIALIAIVAYQVRAIIRHPHSALIHRRILCDRLRNRDRFVSCWLWLIGR